MLPPFVTWTDPGLAAPMLPYNTFHSDPAPLTRTSPTLPFPTLLKPVLTFAPLITSRRPLPLWPTFRSPPLHVEPAPSTLIALVRPRCPSWFKYPLFSAAPSTTLRAPSTSRVSPTFHSEPAPAIVAVA